MALDKGNPLALSCQGLLTPKDGNPSTTLQPVPDCTSLHGKKVVPVSHMDLPRYRDHCSLCYRSLLALLREVWL